MSSVKETIYEMAKDLHAIGALDKKTLRNFDANSLPLVPKYSAKQISSIRHKVGLS